MMLARIAAVVWWLSIGLWISVLIAAGIAAVNVFPTVKEMAVTIPGWAAPESEHWRYAAGKVMDPIFFLADLVQFVVAPLSLLALLGMRISAGPTPRRVAGGVRLAALLIATGLFAWQGLWNAQAMRTGLRQQWDAAKIGDMAEAERLRQDFEDDHQLASSILRFTLLFVVVAGVAGAIDLAPRWANERGGHDALETPALAGTRRR